MSGSIRQSELFAGNNWLAIYKAFSEVNFNAYDFDSVRESMVSYIKRNYPEDFNDWSESSELVALIDLVAYLGQSLAFRMDINARENFLDVARRRESILRLSRFLSYNARRNYPATGLVKLVEIRTTEDVYDSNNRNLNGKIIRWDDPSNADWFEQWILVLNSAMVGTNPFGTPLTALSMNNVKTQLYRFNNVPVSAGNFPFTAYVNNTNYSFDIVNASFDGNKGFYEQDPNLSAPFHVIYRNDGNGNSSADTGFFFMFKQGTLQKQDFQIDDSEENRTIELSAANINETDVWVQSISDSGFMINGGAWSRVGFVPTDNISKIQISSSNTTYNDLDPDVRNIFQAVTQENDRVMLRFGDGRFGNTPVGLLRAWYRISANENLSIRPDDIDNITITLPYNTPENNQYRLTMGFSLQTSVNNGISSESDEDIKRRAGQVYSTQGRMVSGQDYNSLPSTNNVAIKVKAINRVYSGQSRFIDLNDPTGTYQNTNVFSDDGSLYSEIYPNYNEVPFSSNKSSSEIFTTAINPLLQNITIRDFLQSQWLLDNSRGFIWDSSEAKIVWNQSTNQIYNSTGYFSSAIGSSSGLKIGRLITAGALIRLTDSQNKHMWVTVNAVDGSGDQYVSGIGPVRLNEVVASGSYVSMVLPAIKTSLTVDEQRTVISALDTKRSFGISYHYDTRSWHIVDTNRISIDGVYTAVTPNLYPGWLIKCEYTPLSWRITAKGIRYVFESDRDVRFFFVNDFKSIDSQTGRVARDRISVLKYNGGFDQDIKFSLENNYMYSDGYIEPRRVQVGFYDSDNDGQPDDPESFVKILNLNTDVGKLIYRERYQSLDGYEYYRPIKDIVNLTDAMTPRLVVGQVGYHLASGRFYTYSANGNVITDVNAYKALSGYKDISFQWKHYAPINHRIDMAVTNIIDVFVLTREYNESMINWRTNGSNPKVIPNTPSETQLKMNFSDLEEFKMFSDEIIWRPVKFKLLFGSGARSELKAKFKVVKLPGTTTSDGEIKSKIISAINSFFNVNSWNFGETFYESELSSFIHQQLINAISSIELVPMSNDINFGGLAEIPCGPDEIFFPTAQVSDIEIIPANTRTSLRIR